MNYYYGKAKELSADGIDFVSLSVAFLEQDYAHLNIVESYTKEELQNVKVVPKTPYLFWKSVNGNKIYLIDDRS